MVWKWNSKSKFFIPFIPKKSQPSIVRWILKEKKGYWIVVRLKHGLLKIKHSDGAKISISIKKSNINRYFNVIFYTILKFFLFKFFTIYYRNNIKSNAIFLVISTSRANIIIFLLIFFLLILKIKYYSISKYIYILLKKYIYYL